MLVIDEDGNMRGTMSPEEGVAIAAEAGLDLVEVSPNAKPPVCKVLDLGKFKYEAQKKANEAKKKQKVSLLETGFSSIPKMNWRTRPSIPWPVM